MVTYTAVVVHDTCIQNITGKPCCCKETARNAAGVLFGLKFADNIHYKFNSSQASKARLQKLQTYRRKTEFNAKWL